MNWHESNKIICLQYNSYSCGRFVSNILSYNKNFIPQFSLDNSIPISVYSDINFKHDTIMKTIPTNDKLKNWRDYELSCEKFYGFKPYDNVLYKKVLHKPTNTVIKKNLQQILESVKPKAKEILDCKKFFTFIVSHQYFSTEVTKIVFPNAVHIQFVNDELVNKISKKIKSPKSDLPFKTIAIDKSLYHFDIGKIFNKESFFAEIQNLMLYLKCEDLSLDIRVHDYYKKYIDIYKPYIECT